MAYQEFNIGPTWTAAGRLTAVGAKAVAFSSNNMGRSIFFAITTTNTAPTHPYHRGVQVVPGQVHSMELADGERLWFSSDKVQTIGVEVVDA